MKKLIFFFSLFIILFSLKTCKKKGSLFTTLKATHTNITFNNTVKSTSELNILSYLYFYNGGGVAAGDFNNDGLIDIYFTGNQVADKLYINKGSLKFEDITDISGIDNTTPWTTGVTTVDINNDGLLDIYVCKVGKYRSINGQNLLYVNQGLNKDNIPSFKEEAATYGINFQSFSTQAAFFDYDLDGDLDMYLLNHSVHPNRAYGKGAKRNEIDLLSGDKLLRNDAGTFVDVSQLAGIHQGKIGYGLGLSISDLNNDGYPDLYVGNDFFENDYLYINQKDGTFSDININSRKLGHTSHYSMGNDIADLNNDALPDIVSVDMLPEDIITYKTSGLEYNYQIYQNFLKNGYAPQYMQNTLHINSKNGGFSEVAFLSGIAATEWSWSPLLADFDNDGHKDIYITNGILGATNDMDFINFISDEKIQKRIDQGMSNDDLVLIKELPQKKTRNYFFKNKGDNTFENSTKSWSSNSLSFSNGAVYADLDNDGDLDIVVNNINENAYVLENTINETDNKAAYLKFKFKGSDKNTFGIGAKINVFIGEKIIAHENFTTRGYLSSLNPSMNLGLGNKGKIDSLTVIWPGGSYQTLKNVNTNQEMVLDMKESSGNYYNTFNNSKPSFLSNIELLFNVKHKDPASLEFNRDPLIPYASTNLGPGISVADVNNDGMDDVFIGGGKTQTSQLFIQQKDGSFVNEQNEIFMKDAINEDVDHVFFDANNNGHEDLMVVSGGNEFKEGKPLQPRFYRNIRGIFKKDTLQFSNIELNASKVKTVDIDNDGDLDLSITSNLVPLKFGKTPEQYIFENDGMGNFSDITSIFASELKSIGNVQDILWVDLNNNQYKDAIVVGHWMPISIFINDGKKLSLQLENNLERTNGWWNTIKAEDFDKDGDIDLVAGNWGLNTRLKASLDQPITLYSNDFDDNGSVEPLITHYFQGVETPFASKDELVKQMPFLNKKYLSYTAFAHAKFEELFPPKKIKEAYKKEAFELASCYFENDGNAAFTKRQLPFMSQVSSVQAMAIDDFNNDGYFDILLTGNNYEISTQLSSLDASHGVLLLNNKKGFFVTAENQDFTVSGPARDIEKIEIQEKSYYIITINNGLPVFLIKNNK